MNVYPQQLAKLRDNEVVALLHDRYWVLMNEAAYDRQLGLDPLVSGFDPDKLMC